MISIGRPLPICPVLAGPPDPPGAPFEEYARPPERGGGVPTGNLVPGDVVAPEAGDRIPADWQLLRAAGLGVDRSVLVGVAEWGWPLCLAPVMLLPEEARRALVEASQGGTRR